MAERVRQKLADFQTRSTQERPRISPDISEMLLVLLQIAKMDWRRGDSTLKLAGGQLAKLLTAMRITNPCRQIPDLLHRSLHLTLSINRSYEDA